MAAGGFIDNEEAEYLEAARKEAKEKSARIQGYISEVDLSEYAELAPTSLIKPNCPKDGNDERLALEFLLSGLADKARNSKCSKPQDEEEEADDETQVAETTPAVDEALESEEDDESNGQRKVRKMTKQISSNRGLTRVRQKFAGNARVSNRRKYSKKLTKLTGIRMKADEMQASGGYDGESHGITIHVNRSRKIT